jgi:hypothetical protein
MTLPAPPPEKGTRIVFGGAPGMSSQGESRGVPRELRTSCPTAPRRVPSRRPARLGEPRERALRND